MRTSETAFITFGEEGTDQFLMDLGQYLIHQNGYVST